LIRATLLAEKARINTGGLDKMIGKDELAILEKFGLEVEPVGVKYLTGIPTDIKQLDTKMTLCQMLRKAQDGDSFYAGPENHTCDAGPYVLGQVEIKEQFINGEWGAGLGVFLDPRAASRLYHYIPKIAGKVVEYIALAPISKMTFDPDVLVIFARTGQTEIMLRAMAYKTGQMWSSKYSSAVGCAWMLVHPYLSGEINYGITGLGFGMKRRKLFTEGLQWLSIPFTVLPSFLQTLREMPWEPPPYKPDGLEYVERLKARLGLDD
jgi:uncharacterized protein (DUF169 family)